MCFPLDQPPYLNRKQCLARFSEIVSVAHVHRLTRRARLLRSVIPFFHHYPLSLFFLTEMRPDGVDGWGVYSVWRWTDKSSSIGRLKYKLRPRLQRFTLHGWGHPSAFASGFGSPLPAAQGVWVLPPSSRWSRCLSRIWIPSFRCKDICFSMILGLMDDWWKIECWNFLDDRESRLIDSKERCIF